MSGTYTVNPQPSVGDLGTETFASDKSTGLTYYKSEKSIWKVIGIASLVISVVALVLAGVGLQFASKATQLAQDRASCASLSGPSGIYYIKPDQKLNKFPVYCDMDTAGGGWTLVAAVHENNIDGKCTKGDRWSSEQGVSISNSYNGSKNWENINIFGNLRSISSDDYKNIAYYASKARDVMVWHVPNNINLKDISSKAFLKYRTTNGFLSKYGGTLQSLYANHVPMVHAGTGRFFQLVAPPITYDVGNNNLVLQGIPTDQKKFVQPGYLQFRSFDEAGYPNALCPGVRMATGNTAEVCIGGGGAAIIKQSTSFARKVISRSCGDFAGWAGDKGDPGNQTDPSKSGRSKSYINSSILIFIK